MSLLKRTGSSMILFNTYSIRYTGSPRVLIPHDRDRIAFLRKTEQTTCPVNQFRTFLSSKNLFNRKVIFLTKDQIKALPEDLANKGWKTFFDAMYLLIQRKNTPKDLMSADELKAKNVNIPEAINLLTSLLKRPAEELDPNIRPPALMMLAFFYEFGLGINQNIPKARALYTEAMQLGVTEAKVELATLEPDYRVKLKYLEEAHKERSLQALIGLGDLYCQKNLPIYDIEKAETYLNQAIAMGSGEAAYILLQHYMTCTPQAKAKIVELLYKAVELNYTEAYTILGTALICGNFGLKKNLKRAEKIFTRGYYDREGEAAYGLSHIHQEKNFIKLSIKYSIKAIRYGTSIRNEIVKLIVATQNSLLAPSEMKDKTELIMMCLDFDIRNGTKIFPLEEALAQAPASTNTEEHNKQQYDMLMAYVPDRLKPFLQDIDKARTAENLTFIQQVAIPLLHEFNSVFTLAMSYLQGQPLGPSAPTQFSLFIKKVHDGQYRHMAEDDYQKKLLMTYASCTPLDILYLRVILGNSNFYFHLPRYFPPYMLKDRPSIQLAHNKLVLLTLQLAVMPLSEFTRVYQSEDGTSKHYLLIENALKDMQNLIENCILYHYHPRQLDGLILLLTTFGGLHKKSQSAQQRNSTYNAHRESILQLIEKIGMSFENGDNHLEKDLAGYSLEEQRACVNALRAFGFNSKSVLALLPPFKAQAQKERFTKYMEKIESAITVLYKKTFALELEADRIKKAQEAEARALEDQRKAAEVKKTLWLKIQQNILKDCTSHRQKLDSLDISSLHHEDLTKILQEMIKMNELIQDTADYTPSHNTHFQNLKKRFNYLSTLSQKQSYEQYEATTSTVIAEVETYRIESLNLKKEIMAREAARFAEEETKLKEAQAAKAERAAQRADKQREYQETQEAIFARSISPEQSSSDEDSSDTLGAGSIASFKGKDAKHIFESQEDQFGGNAVRILTLIHEAKSFEDIVKNKTQGDNLHDLNGKDILLPNGDRSACYALRVNDRYRITFYWSNTENKAYNVWFGDYHVKQ